MLVEIRQLGLWQAECVCYLDHPFPASLSYIFLEGLDVIDNIDRYPAFFLDQPSLDGMAVWSKRAHLQCFHGSIQVVFSQELEDEFDDAKDQGRRRGSRAACPPTAYSENLT